MSHLAYKSENVGKRNTRISYLHNESDSLFKDVRSPDNLDEEEYADLIQQIDKKSNDISVENIGANRKKEGQQDEERFGSSGKRGSQKTRPSTSHTITTNKRVSATSQVRGRRLNGISNPQRS